VHFLGERNDVAALLDASDAFVFPSLSEGLPLAPLEAMAMGKLAVLSRIGPHEEIVEDGVSGLLVPPREAPRLAAAMSRAQRDGELRMRVAECGRLVVLKRFDARACAHRLQLLYQSLV
jgi:glycosyltransferase involved in cell wall biosynthesis